MAKESGFLAPNVLTDIRSVEDMENESNIQAKMQSAQNRLMNAADHAIDETNLGTGRPSVGNALDPESSKQLHNMVATGNYTGEGGGLSPEYLSKIPAKYHNQITLQCATEKVSKMRIELDEKAAELAGNVATEEILDEAAEHIVYKEYTTEELDGYMEHVDELSLLELVMTRNSITKEIFRMDSCKEMLKSADEMRKNFDYQEPDKEITLLDKKNAGTDVNTEIMKANYLDEFDFDGTAEDFEKFYAEAKPRYNGYVDRLDTLIDQKREDSKSTKKLSEDMCNLIQKRVDAYPEDMLNRDYKTLRMMRVKEAFANRLDFSYLTKEFNKILSNKSMVRDLNRALRAGRLSKISDTMNHLFTKENMRNLSRFIFMLTENDPIFTLQIMYLLNKIAKREKISNYNAYVKTLVLNITDFYNEIFDLAEDPNELAHIVREALIEHVDWAPLHKGKGSKVEPNIIADLDLLMNPPAPKEEPEEEEEVAEEAPELEETQEETSEPEEEEEVERVEAEIVDVNGSFSPNHE